MDKEKTITILKDLLATDLTAEQKEAIEKAIQAIRTEQWMEALKILAGLVGIYIKTH
jgi:hypothetical protein